MVRRIELANPAAQERFANPAPLGLLGLAVGCAALVPSTFGFGLTPAGLKTAAVFALLFGGGCQLLAGLMLLANRNGLSGTVFTAFAFLWGINAWTLHALSRGVVPDHHVVLATEIVLLLVFVALTYAFGFVSKLLFIFLLDIDALFAVRLFGSIAGRTDLGPVIGVLTIVLAALSLWLAFAALVNPLAGRQIFRLGGPLMVPRGASGDAGGFDWSTRRAIFDALYRHWQDHAFSMLSTDALREALPARCEPARLNAELRYLGEFGYLKLSPENEADEVTGARLTAAGIDLYEQLVLRKYG